MGMLKRTLVEISDTNGSINVANTEAARLISLPRSASRGAANVHTLITQGTANPDRLQALLKT